MRVATCLYFSEKLVLASSYFRALEKILPLRSDVISENEDESADDSGAYLASRVLSAAVADVNTQNLDPPIQLGFIHVRYYYCCMVVARNVA